MRYKKFYITGYRGLQDNTEIDISKTSLYPIIGKNESGKTTCLEAIYSFDNSNDTENGGRHLKNVENLYSTIEKPILITAEIEIDIEFKIQELFTEQINVYKLEYCENFPEEDFNINVIDIEKNKFSNWNYIKAYQLLQSCIENSVNLSITRDLRTKYYNVELIKEIVDIQFSNRICNIIVKKLPYILYFDDFRDRIPERLFIIHDNLNPLYSKWILYIDEIFKETNFEYSVFTLANRHDSIRRSIITEVQKHLEKRLIVEWSKYQFDNIDNIKIQIEYNESQDGPFLQFKIIEIVQIDGMDKERFFDISDRSKGFYWYFNFMMKLHFNPSKRGREDKDTIYLLDEPGSYLHTYALNKLAEQLKNLSINNKVIYCTHSHNLLNPNFIPINSIRLAEKTDRGKIYLKQLDHKGLVRPIRNSAYQPVFDALEVSPPLVEYDFDDVILLEGIYDYYSFKMFTKNNLSYFPCVSASSIIHQIPYMIFLGKRYLAVWDNDEEGRRKLKKASELFGEIESSKFITLDSINNKDTRLEEYYEKSEIAQFNSNINGKSQTFEKTILSLFYSENKAEYILKYFPKTSKNFLKMELILVEKLNSQKIIEV